MEKIPMPDEPVFTLMGRDPQAPRLIREWADQREERIAAGHSPITDYAAVARARALADEMEEWRHEVVKLAQPTPMPLFEKRNNPV
jgi:hypothetical protein